MTSMLGMHCVRIKYFFENFLYVLHIPSALQIPFRLFGINFPPSSPKVPPSASKWTYRLPTVVSFQRTQARLTGLAELLHFAFSLVSINIIFLPLSVFKWNSQWGRKREEKYFQWQNISKVHVPFKVAFFTWIILEGGV